MPDPRYGDHVPRRRFLRRLTAGSVAVASLAGCGPQVLQPLALARQLSNIGPESDVPASLADPQLEVVETPAPTPPPPAPPPPMPVFYRPEYTLAGFSYDTTRKAAWVADSLSANPLVGLDLVAPDLLTDSEVSAVHDPAYVSAVRTGSPRALAQSQGFTWDAGLWPMVLASNGGAVAAALAAVKTGVAGSLSSGLHHARRNHGNGNCTFNGLPLAVRALQATGVQRILIVDLDAHCGGGTNELVGGNPNVRQVDVAVYPFDVYSPAGQNTLDLVQSARNYLPTIQRRLDALDPSAYDICLYNAGMDPHEGCPLGGLPGITTSVLASREQMVFQWCRRNELPVAFVLAGGYVGPALSVGGLTALHRLTLDAATQIPTRVPAI